MDCKKDDNNRYLFNMKIVSTKDKPVKAEKIDNIVKDGLNIPSVGGITKQVRKKEKTNKTTYIIVLVVLIIVILGAVGASFFLFKN